MRIIPQRSTAFLTLSFLDTKGEAMPPTSAQYRIDDLGSGAEILDDTAFIVPPDGVFVIRLSPDDNDLVDPLNAREQHRVSVTGFYNLAGDEVPAAYDYSIDRVFIQPPPP